MLCSSVSTEQLRGLSCSDGCCHGAVLRREQLPHCRCRLLRPLRVVHWQLVYSSVECTPTQRVRRPRHPSMAGGRPARVVGRRRAWARRPRPLPRGELSMRDPVFVFILPGKTSTSLEKSGTSLGKTCEKARIFHLQNAQKRHSISSL